MSVRRSNRSHLLLALLLACFAIWPLTAPGYFAEAHDAPHSLFFLVEFDQAIRDGALIPRWGTDHALGYGYPTFVYISPLSYYVAEGFYLAGAGVTAAVKLTFALAMLLSALGMFLLARELVGPVAACVAATVYVYAPYRFLDMYVRADLAESSALALFPWVCWAFWRLATRPDLRHISIAAVAYGALLLTHNLTAFLFTPLLSVFVLFALWQHGRLRQRRAWVTCLTAAMLAVGIASFSLLPALLERSYISQQQWTRGSYDFAQHFVYPGQLLSPFWGYGHDVPGANDGMSLQVGLAPLLLAMGGVFLGGLGKSRRALTFFLALGMVGYLFLVLPYSEAVWRALPVLALVQFPWRLLSMVVFCAALVAAVMSQQLAEVAAGPGAAVALALAVVTAGIGYAQPQHTPPSARAESPLAVIDFELEYPDMIGITTWVQQPPTDSPKLAAYLAGQPLPLAEADIPGAQVEAVYHGGHVQAVRVHMPADGQLHFYTYYFPGWRAYVDGQEVPIWPSGPQAIITLALSAGEHNVTIRFGETPLRAAAKWVTLVAVAITTLLSTRPIKLFGVGKLPC